MKIKEHHISNANDLNVLRFARWLGINTEQDISNVRLEILQKDFVFKESCDLDALRFRDRTY